MVERLQAHGLTLSRRTKVGLESVGIDDRDEGFDGVEGRACFGNVFGDVTSTTSKDGEDGRDAVCWCLDFDGVHGLH